MSPNGVAGKEPHPRFNLPYLQLHRPERRRLAVGLRSAPLHGFSMAALQAGPSSRTSAVVHSCEQLLVLHELPQPERVLAELGNRHRSTFGISRQRTKTKQMRKQL